MNQVSQYLEQDVEQSVITHTTYSMDVAGEGISNIRHIIPKNFAKQLATWD